MVSKGLLTCRGRGEGDVHGEQGVTNLQGDVGRVMYVVNKAGGCGENDVRGEQGVTCRVRGESDVRGEQGVTCRA